MSALGALLEQAREALASTSSLFLFPQIQLSADETRTTKATGTMRVPRARVQGEWDEAWYGFGADHVRVRDWTGLSEDSWLSVLYPFEAENAFEWRWSMYLRRYHWLPWALSAVYCFLVLYVGPRLMRDRPPMQVPFSLRLWNLFLAVFSFLGMVRTMPQLLAIVGQDGWRMMNCGKASDMYGLGAAGLWTMLFVHSKYVEFVDTFFLIVRKKPVSLLHWYHHASVLLYAWHASMHETPSGLVFVAMNYAVHALMYFYYFLTTSKIFPAWAHVVTKLQILQMVLGIYTTASALFYWSEGGCDTPSENLVFAGGIYFSYLLLFAQFYVGRYFGGGKKSSTGTGSPPPASGDGVERATTAAGAEVEQSSINRAGSREKNRAEQRPSSSSPSSSGGEDGRGNRRTSLRSRRCEKQKTKPLSSNKVESPSPASGTSTKASSSDTD